LLRLLETVETCILPSGEKLYSVTDLYEKVKAAEDNICLSGATVFLVPEYVVDGKRMELYWLDLEISDPFCREESLLRKTGKSRISEIPQHIIDLFDRCHLTVQPPERTISKDALCAYLEWLLTHDRAEEDICSTFGFYHRSHLFFEVY